MRYALKASIGEVGCSRALLLACAGRLDDAIELVDEVRGTTTAVELVVLAPAVDAVCALRSGASDIVERVTTLESAAFRTGAVDLLVTTYRACPSCSRSSCAPQRAGGFVSWSNELATRISRKLSAIRLLSTMTNVSFSLVARRMCRPAAQGPEQPRNRKAPLYRGVDG